MDTTFFNQLESMPKLGSEIKNKLLDLSDLHIKLTKEEFKENKHRAILASVLLSAGAVTAFASILIGSFALVQVLTESSLGLSSSVALLCVSALWFLMTFILILSGLKIFKRINFIPVTTIASIKESYKCLLENR